MSPIYYPVFFYVLDISRFSSKPGRLLIAYQSSPLLLCFLPRLYNFIFTSGHRSLIGFRSVQTFHYLVSCKPFILKRVTVSLYEKSIWILGGLGCKLNLVHESHSINTVESHYPINWNYQNCLVKITRNKINYYY